MFKYFMHFNISEGVGGPKRNAEIVYAIYLKIQMNNCFKYRFGFTSDFKIIK